MLSVYLKPLRHLYYVSVQFLLVLFCRFFPLLRSFLCCCALVPGTLAFDFLLTLEFAIIFCFFDKQQQMPAREDSHRQLPGISVRAFIRHLPPSARRCSASPGLRIIIVNPKRASLPPGAPFAATNCPWRSAPTTGEKPHPLSCVLRNRAATQVISRRLSSSQSPSRCCTLPYDTWKSITCRATTRLTPSAPAKGIPVTAQEQRVPSVQHTLCSSLAHRRCNTHAARSI